MENLSEAQQSEQSQQILTQPTRSQSFAEQSGASAAQNKRKREAEKLLGSKIQDPLRRPEAPQPSRVYNQCSQRQGRTINPAPDDHKHNQDMLISEASPEKSNRYLRQGLRGGIRKEMEKEWEKKLAESNLKIENIWMEKWKQKVEEVEMHYMKKLKEAESHHNNDDIRAPHGEIYEEETIDWAKTGAESRGQDAPH